MVSTVDSEISYPFCPHPPDMHSFHEQKAERPCVERKQGMSRNSGGRREVEVRGICEMEWNGTEFFGIP